jgi:single-strand selective monofunctional uracil DNA glycosylase
LSIQRISDALSESVRALQFSPPITHVYNPLEYARAPHHRYLEKYGRGDREVVFLGMNPGPFGMAQTGVPFGDVKMVRDWLAIDEPVGKPPHEHPKRIVQGFACTRSEVSGTRLWGWARDRFKTPESFFARFFVWNYCPLFFMEESGRNFTPDKLPAKEKEALQRICGSALAEIVAIMNPKYVIGVGAFAETRAREALNGYAGIIGSIPHPSPANPAANRGWAAAAEKALEVLGVHS